MRLAAGYIYLEVPLRADVDRGKVVSALLPLLAWYDRESMLLTHARRPGYEQLAIDIDCWGEIDEHCEEGPSFGYDVAHRVLTFMHLGQFPWESAKRIMETIGCALEPFAETGFISTIEESGAQGPDEAEGSDESTACSYFGPTIEARETIRLHHQVEQAQVCRVSFAGAACD